MARICERAYILYELEWYRVETCVSNMEAQVYFFAWCINHLYINHRYATIVYFKEVEK